MGYTPVNFITEHLGKSIRGDVVLRLPIFNF